MRHFLSRDQREDSVESSSSKSSTSSFRTWYKKRKRDSFSPSPPCRQGSSGSEGTSVDSSRVSTRSRDQKSNSLRLFHRINSAGHPYLAQDSLVVNRPQHIQQRNTSLPAAQTQELNQIERIISNCRPARPGRRRSSARLPEILPPQDFTAKELRMPIELSKPSCPFFVGLVFRPLPELALRVETKARSRESVFVSTRPLYYAQRHSPLVTGRPATTYFEGKIRPGNDEDGVRLALGFLAGRDRASLMPGSERGSIGIHFHDQGLYVNHQLLAKAAFKPGDHIGIGMKFSNSNVNAQEVDDYQSSATPSSSIIVEVFLTRDGKKAGCWNLSELREAGSLPFEGLEGNHDLYAAVGTLKAVNVDILFDKRSWRYDPTAA